jgi:hypothetical protein
MGANRFRPWRGECMRKAQPESPARRVLSRVVHAYFPTTSNNCCAIAGASASRYVR